MGTRAPKIIATPAAIISQATPCPSQDAQRVARRKSSVIAQKKERTTRPPSSGKPGIRLKNPTKTLTGPNHSSNVRIGSRPAMRSAGSVKASPTGSAPNPEASMKTIPSTMLVMGPTMAS